MQLPRCPVPETSRNQKELKDITERLNIPRYPTPHDVTMTIQTVEELNVDSGIVIKCPQPKKYTPVDTCYKTTHEEDSAQTIHPASKKLLFIYSAKTNTNESILVMADPGATLSILNKRAITKVGPCADNGSTRLRGLKSHKTRKHEIYL